MFSSKEIMQVISPVQRTIIEDSTISLSKKNIIQLITVLSYEEVKKKKLD